MPSSLPRLAAAVLITVMFATACGGSDDGVTDDLAASSTTATATADAVPDTDEPDPAPESDGEDAAADTPEPEPAPESDDEEPEPAPEPEGPEPLAAPPATGPADLPDLVIAWSTASAIPLDIARDIIGFPFEIELPEAANPHAIRVELDTREAEVWRWDWTYSGVSIDGDVGAVDAELPEGGEGTIEGRLHFDAVFGALGFRNVSQVISDPSSGGGGPQSVNWAYQTDLPSLLVGEIETTPATARAWVDEDLSFHNDTPLAGYQIDVALETAPGTIPVPLIDTIISTLPFGADARITEIDFASFDRAEDSFAADEGLRYLELEIVYVLPAGSEAAAQDLVLGGLDGDVFQVGEESFFDEGFITVTEALINSDGDWRQPVVMLSRYPGIIEVATADDGAVEVSVDITLEPNRELLEPLPED